MFYLSWYKIKRGHVQHDVQHDVQHVVQTKDFYSSKQPPLQPSSSPPPPTQPPGPTIPNYTLKNGSNPNAVI